jgi:hypothetical protein
MGGPTGVPERPATTFKDVLIDFLAGGTGLFFSYYINQIFSYFILYFSCMYLVIIYILIILIIILVGSYFKNSRCTT